MSEQSGDQFQYQSPTTQPGTSGLAIGSLISSILGLSFVPFIGSIVGLVLGYLARKAIRQNADTVGGDGLAKAGIIIGWVGIGLFGVGTCVIVMLALLGPAIGGVFDNIVGSLN